MKCRLRIIGDNYYPEVKTGWFSWRRIAKHSAGEYGLYDTIIYPKSREAAIEIIRGYREYKSESSRQRLTKFEYL